MDRSGRTASEALSIAAGETTGVELVSQLRNGVTSITATAATTPAAHATRVYGFLGLAVPSPTGALADGYGVPL